jgi:hypothetical protein
MNLEQNSANTHQAKNVSNKSFGGKWNRTLYA